MATGIDQIRTTEPRTDQADQDRTDSHLSRDDTQLARVDVSGVSLAAIRRIVDERAATPVHVEHRAGSTYLVADHDRRPA